MRTFLTPQLRYKLDLAKLQQKRHKRLCLWRTWLLICSTIGLSFTVSSGYWQIQNIDQITVEGEKFVSEQKILEALQLKFPSLIWQIDSEDLVARLQNIASVRAAQVNRQIAPVQLIVSIQEKIPVAIATSNTEIGFLDAQGEWISHQLFDNLTNDMKLPPIKVNDYQEQFKITWQNLYQLIKVHPELKISEVYWNASGNLFIQSQIGQIRLGPDHSQLHRQFKTMLKLKNLNQYLDSSKIAYIDLSNPEANLIQKY